MRTIITKSLISVELMACHQITQDYCIRIGFQRHNHSYPPTTCLDFKVWFLLLFRSDLNCCFDNMFLNLDSATGVWNLVETLVCILREMRAFIKLFSNFLFFVQKKL